MWTDVTVAIPTVPARAQMSLELSAHVMHECPGATVIRRMHVAGTSPRIDLPALCDCAVAAGRRWTLHLEDDVWTCPRFGGLALAAAVDGEALGASAVSLFSRSSRDLACMNRGERWRRQAPSSFCASLAVFVRTEILSGLAAWAPEWYSAHPQHEHAADLLLGAWLSRARATMLVHVPSLVQHRAVPSTMKTHRGTRQSESYQRAFGEAP